MTEWLHFSLLFLIRKDWGLPQWLSGKESNCRAGDRGDLGSISGLRRSPGGGHGNPHWYSYLKNPMDRGNPRWYCYLMNPMDRRPWWAIVHGVAKSWHTEVTEFMHRKDWRIFECWWKGASREREKLERKQRGNNKARLKHWEGEKWNEMGLENKQKDLPVIGGAAHFFTLTGGKEKKMGTNIGEIISVWWLEIEGVYYWSNYMS